jgi:hypothetical protein
MRHVTGTTGQRYAVSDDELGSGGEAKLFRCTDPSGKSRVYKSYDSPAGPETAARLAGLQRTGLTIVQSAERSRTFADSPSSSINWPIDLVPGLRGRISGVILPLIPAQFMQPSRPARTLDFLTLARSVPPPPDAQARVGVLIRLCNILGYLESRQLVHGDVSAKNIVWHADPPQAYLIDCDGLSPFDPPPQTGVVTFGWEDPRAIRKVIPAHDRYSDRYALALALYRGLFLNPGGPKYLDDGSWLRPSGFPPGLDPALSALFGRALNNPLATDTRPTAQEWIAALTKAFISGSGYQRRALAVLDTYAQERRDEYARSVHATVVRTSGQQAATAPLVAGHARTPQTLIVPQGPSPQPFLAPGPRQTPPRRGVPGASPPLHPLPQPPPPPPQKRPRRSAAWVLVPLVLVAAAAAAGWQEQHHHQQVGTRQQSQSPPAAPACPSTVTSHLAADQRQGAVLLHHYLTRIHDITLCATRSGAVYYHGEVRDKPSLGSITIPAERTDTGYVAHNLDYTYTIHGSQVTVGRPRHANVSYAFVDSG